MSEQLIHYSAQPIDTLRPVSPDVRPNGKPVGFWLSVEGEDDWKHWCEAEDFNLEALTFAHQVTLKPDANILRLSGPLDIDLFTEKYGKSRERSSSRRDIDWLRFATEYQGIIIAPYCWSRRMSEHTFWYYGWDCSSGCIWDVNAIERIELTEPRTYKCFCGAEFIIRFPENCRWNDYESGALEDAGWVLRGRDYFCPIHARGES